MKIALVTETYPPEVNGVAMTLHRLATGLVKLGHTLQVARPRQGKTDAPQNSEGYHELLVPGLPLPGYEGLHFGLPAKSRLKRSWQAARPDVVHIATEGPLGWSALRAARSLQLPLVSSFHTNFHAYGKHYGYGWMQSVALGWLRYVHNRTLATFAPSQDLIELLQKERFRNVKLLSRGVDTELFSPARRSQTLRESWGAREDTPVALYVGRLAGEKNINLTVQAYTAMKATLPDLRLVMVGDGPERKRLQKNYPEAHFAGLRRGEDLATHYASGDVFLFASVTETFGNVITEAMASGLCVLCYNYAAGQRFIENGKNGMVADYDKTDAYLAAADTLAKAHWEWPAMRQAARETAARISWEAVIRQYTQDLEAVLERRQQVTLL